MTVATLKSILSKCDDDMLVLLEEPINEDTYQLVMMAGARKEGNTVTLFGVSD